jgi:hypothetical protein
MHISFGTSGSAGVRHCYGLEGPVPMETLAAARRRARLVLGLLWLVFAGLAIVLPLDVMVAITVLLAGVSTLLLSAHGALAFDRLTRRPGPPAAPG